MSTSRRWSREDGLGSVEMLLTLPVLLLMILAMLHGTRMMLAKQHASAATRRATWVASLDRHLDDVFAKNVSLSLYYCNMIDSNDFFGGEFLIDGAAKCAKEDKKDSEKFLKELENVEENEAAGVTNDVEDQNNAVMTTIKATYAYTYAGPGSAQHDSEATFALGYDWSVDAELSHTVSGNRSWQITDMPKGYNKTLKQKLDAADKKTVLPAVASDVVRKVLGTGGSLFGGVFPGEDG